MHQLKIIDGRLHLDGKKLCGVQDYYIRNTETNMCELNLKMMVDLTKIDGKEQVSERIESLQEQFSEGKVSANRVRTEFGLKPIDEGNVLTKVKHESNNEPIEIKRQIDSWHDLKEMGVTTKNEKTVSDIVKLLLESGLTYLEMNRVLRDADGALRHKAFSTVLGQSNKPNYIPYGQSESDFMKP